MATKFLNYRGVKREGQISWTVHLSFVIIFLALYLTVFSWIKTLWGLIILGAIVFIFCYLLFNKHPVHFMLILKSYWRESKMSPTPVDTLKVENLRDIPSLKQVFDRLDKQKNK